MRKLLISQLPSASVPSVSIIPTVMPSALRSKAAMSVQCVGGSVEGARKRMASADASAPHAAVALLKYLVAGVKSAPTTNVGWLGNGSTFGPQAQAQATFDSPRVDGRAGSPPRGTPV